MIQLTVVICTYNPKKEVFEKVLFSLENQTLSKSKWELIIIDNNSSHNINWIDISFHNYGKIIKEEKPGLTFARLAGFKNAKGSLIVMVDDDNLLEEHYLEYALIFSLKNPQVGCYGGKSIPKFEVPPSKLFYQTGITLGCQDLGDYVYISNYRVNSFEITDYPLYSPIGTGMIIIKKALDNYISFIENSSNVITDRKGNNLSSGGDNEIVIFVVRAGWEIAYFPSLLIDHLIPAGRLTFEYLCRMSKDSSKSWVILCRRHKIGSYKSVKSNTILLRKVRSFIMQRAFISKLQYIKWKGACGIFEGLAVE